MVRAVAALLHRLLVALALIVSLLATVSAWAQDTAGRVTVRGNYYREHSTRVLQPLVAFDKGLAGGKVSVGVEYALDAISSASIAAGSAALGGDKVFHENRHESGARVGLYLGPWSTGLSYRYSTETDYEAQSASAWLSREFFERRTALFASYTGNFNRAYRIRNNLGDRAAWTSTGTTNLLQVHHAIASVTHILSPRWFIGLSVDAQLARGPQDNPYRRVVSGRNESHPLARNRLALTAFGRYAIKPIRTVIEPEYRYYTDTWRIHAHTLDARAHVRLFAHWRLRVRYRYYRQNAAFFWQPPSMEDFDAAYVTADPKMAAFASHTPGIQLTWELDRLARYRGLDWLAGGWIQATYNHVFQGSDFPDARLGALSFSLAF